MAPLLPSDDCNQDCVLCATQLWPPSCTSETGPHAYNQVSDEYARQRAIGLAEQAKADQSNLRKGLVQHGALVRSVWKSMDTEQREAVLLELCPDMCKDNYLQLRLMVEESPATLRLTRDEELLPYLNLPTLRDDPMKLLGLLQHRSDPELEEWIAFDIDHVKIDTLTSSIEYNGNCVILRGERYGQLVRWDRREAHQFRMVGYTLAVLVLEAQSSLMNFLRRMYEKLVALGVQSAGDKVCESRGTAPGSRTEGSKCWSLFMDQAFSPPPRFCAQSFSAKIEAELGAVRDHLHLLQTDPEYVQDLMTASRPSYQGLKFSGQMNWGLQAMELVSHPISDAISFASLSTELQRLVHISLTPKDGFALDNSPNSDYERSLGVLEDLANTVYSQYRTNLGLLLFQTSGFQQSFQLRKGGSKSIKFVVRDARKSKSVSFESAYFHDDPLFFALGALMRDQDDPHYIRHHELAAFIADHLAQASERKDARLTQLVYDHLSRLLLVGELATVLRLHRPQWIGRVSLTGPERGRVAKVLRCPQAPDFSPVAMTELGLLLKDCCLRRWPAGVRDQRWLKKAQAARARLSAFWARARAIRWAHLRANGVGVMDMAQEMTLWSADSSEEHHEELRKEKETVVAERTQAPKKSPTKSPKNLDLDSLQTVWGDDNTPSSSKRSPAADRVTSKKRVKNTAEKHVPSDQPTNEKDRKDTGHRQISVSKASLALFNNIFPSTNQSAERRPTKWTSFVSAMVDTGFRAGSWGGSAVHFSRDSAAGGGGMVVHKPHPDSNISPIMLKVLGNRLRKRFGWERDVFVERAKGSAGENAMLGLAKMTIHD